MKTIVKLESMLTIYKKELSQCIDPDRNAELETLIDALQDDIDERYEDEADAQSYEEATGTTPQDLYLERNSYAVRQSEMIDQFRNEY